MDLLFFHYDSVTILQLPVEGNSIRSTERITGIHRDSIMRLLVKAGERCEALLAEKVRIVPVSDVQCDEIWGFVAKRESRRVYGDKNFHYIGDAWTFIAIERNSKLVLDFEVASATRNPPADSCGNSQ